MSIERLRALENAVELVAKATKGPWAFMNEKFDDCLLAFGTASLEYDAPPPWYSCWTSINPDDGRALIAAVNFIREHGSALIAELGQEVGAVATPLTDDEHEWLMYAVDHMLDDSEPEDKACARVLQGLLDRCVVTSNAQLPHPLGERHAAIEKALKGQTLLLMSRDHFNDQKKPLAEIKYGMSTDLGVLFCLADTKAPMPVDTSPAHTSEARDADALARFTEYFVKNYPGDRGGTLICDPTWHAPKIFRAAKYAIDAAMRQEGGTP